MEGNLLEIYYQRVDKEYNDILLTVGNCADYGYISHEMIKGILQTQERIDKAIEYIKCYESIRGYYEYVECGYDEYNYEEDLKEELLELLKGEKE